MGEAYGPSWKQVVDIDTTNDVAKSSKVASSSLSWAFVLAILNYRDVVGGDQKGTGMLAQIQLCSRGACEEHLRLC